MTKDRIRAEPHQLAGGTRAKRLPEHSGACTALQMSLMSPNYKLKLALIGPNSIGLYC